MARRAASGGIVERDTSRGRAFDIRYRANGRRYSELVGYAPQTTREDAERALGYVREQIRRGEWKRRASDPSSPSRAFRGLFHDRLEG